MKVTIKSILIITVAIFLISCSGKKKSPSVKTKLTVGTIEVVPENLEDYIEFGGNVRAVDTVAVLPTAAGKISRFMVNAGDQVKKGDVIALIDPSKPGSEFALSPVKASTSGSVTNLPLSAGAYATVSTSIAEISSTNDLEIDVFVSERFLPLIQKGQHAEISFKSYPDMIFDAEIIRLSPILDPATRTMQVTLKLNEKKDIVKAGMFAHVKIITQTKNEVLTVPNRSIVENSEKFYVFLANELGDKAQVRRTPIVKGLTVDGKTEIVSGLEAGNLLVVKGQNMISDGQSVKAIKSN